MTINGLAKAYTGTPEYDNMNNAGIAIYPRGTNYEITVRSTSGDIALNSKNLATAEGRSTFGMWITGNPTNILSDSGAITLRTVTGNDEAFDALNIGNSTAIGALSGQTASGPITVQANKMRALSDSALFRSTGTLTVAPTTAGSTVGIGGASGTLQLPASYFSTNFENGFANIIIGSADQTGDISIGATTLSDSLTLHTTGDVTQTGALTGNQNLNLLGTGGTYTLTNTSNAINQLTANTGSISFVNSDALSLGAITATGAVDVRTDSGNLTVSGDISTDDTSANALLLAADSTRDAGDTDGGNIILSGSPSISVGSGGVARLYSGLPDSSTGLSAAVDNVRALCTRQNACKHFKLFDFFCQAKDCTS